MIDLAWLRKEPHVVKEKISKKDPAYDMQLLIMLDQQVRDIQQQVETLRHEKNEVSSLAKSGITDELRAKSIAVGKQLKEKETELETIKSRFTAHYLQCPNIPFEEVPVGNKAENKVIKEYGSKRTFDFEPKNHMELGQKLGWFDFDAAATMTGSNFAFYLTPATELLYELAIFMLRNNRRHGYTMLQPPVMVNEESLYVSTNFPKFRDQVYKITDENLYMTPTAEVNFANMYRNQIVPLEQLPIRMTGYTSCFRREAGTYGAQERGLIRLHQFEKVELFSICTPDRAIAEHEHMLACAEAILQALDLHYRVVLLAGQDCSFPSAKTYDIEVWLPGQNAYYEVSSISNCTDFQSRRGKIRFKDTADAKPELVYTLNGSSLALPRLMVALMENYQQKDGSIKLPSIITSLWS